MSSYANWLTAIMLGVAAFGVIYLFVLAAIVWPLQDRKRAGDAE